jgi:Flp pilus assembly protein TadG
MRMRTELSRRGGATLLETSAIIVLASMFLFGIIEYGRLLFVRQVMDNAAREGARHAVVRVLEDDVDGGTKAVVHQRMAGVQNMLQNFEVKVYKADSTGKPAGSPDGAEFGAHIAVEIACDYEPVLPTFLLMGTTFHLRSKVLMNSEAN